MFTQSGRTAFLIFFGLLVNFVRGQDSDCWNVHRGVCTKECPTNFDVAPAEHENLCNTDGNVCCYPKDLGPRRSFDSDICGLNTIENTVDAFIVNGNTTRAHEFPWFVSLREFDEAFCGGVILSEKWVLTAAHCLEDTDLDQLTVHAGVVHIADTKLTNDKIQSSGAASMKLHELYDSEEVINDIALIELETPLTFNDAVRPVCLPLPIDHEAISSTKFNRKTPSQNILHTNNDIDSKVFTVIGFGSSESEMATEDLRKLRIPGVPLHECVQKNQGIDTYKSMICTGFEEGKRDSCEGDSGGPLTVLKKDTLGQERAVLDGIVSFGLGCADPATPGYYTRVSFYLDWIDYSTKERFTYKDGRYAEMTIFNFPYDEKIN